MQETRSKLNQILSDISQIKEAVADFVGKNREIVERINLNLAEMEEHMDEQAEKYLIEGKTFPEWYKSAVYVNAETYPFKRLVSALEELESASYYVGKSIEKAVNIIEKEIISNEQQ